MALAKGVAPLHSSSPNIVTVDALALSNQSGYTAPAVPGSPRWGEAVARRSRPRGTILGPGGAWRRGLNRSGVDPPLSSSRACLTTFIANSVP